ncbi:MAG: GAF domain-containing protein [Anaerolineales bacterium]|nr:GAF domain-containing protein [Anaerolineales bacterium]
MSPASDSSNSNAVGPLASRVFWVFFLICLLPMLILAGYLLLYSGGLFYQLPFYVQQRAVIAALAAALLVGLLVWFAARRFTHQLSTLAETMERFLDGERHLRAPTSMLDETAQLTDLFNRMADELSEFYNLAKIRENEDSGARPQAAALMVQMAHSADKLDSLLKGGLEVFLRHFACSFGALYLLEGKELAGKSYAVLAQTAGSLDGEAQALAKRFEEVRISLDLTPTMDWMVGRSLATRRPQVGAASFEGSLYEAALPLVLPMPGEARLLGAIDLLSASRVKDSRLGPFSVRAVAEMQAAANVLALAIAAFQPSLVRVETADETTSSAVTPIPSRPRPASLNMDERTLYQASRQILLARNSDQVLEALRQAVRTAPYASAALLRPLDADPDSALPVIVCRALRATPPGMNEPPLTLRGPRLREAESHFRANQGAPLLLYDLDLNSEEETVAPGAPPELTAIARRLGCRSAAYIPAMREERLTALLLVGASPELPAPLFRAEMLEPFANLINLAAESLERIHNEQLIQRKLSEMETLGRFSQAIAKETDLSILLPTLHRQVENVLGALSSFAVGLYDAENNTVRIPYMVEEGRQLNIPPFPLGEGLSSIVIHSGKPLLLATAQEVNEYSRLHGARQVGEPAKSWLGAPMLYSGQVIGLIIVQDVQRERRFTEEDARLLNTLAAQVAAVVHNARLLERSKRQAYQERLAAEISDRVRRSVDMQTILKTTADELARALGARRASIRVGLLEAETRGGQPGNGGAAPLSRAEASPDEDSAEEGEAKA